MTRMECGEVRDLLHAYSDQELPAEEHRAVATHVEHCRDCAEAAGQLEALRQRVRRAGTHAVPPAFEQRLRSAIGTEDFNLSRPRHPSWALLAASHALALVLGGVLAFGLLSHDHARERVIRDVVAAHARAFLADQPVQIASADTHTVKPWFVGRLSYAPDVRDLGTTTFPSRVPASITCWIGRQRPSSTAVASTASTCSSSHLTRSPDRHHSKSSRNGYNILVWPQGDFAHYAGSDLNRDELRRFAELLRARSH